DTVRMMLTGNADMGNAVQAVNEGNIFRFFTKPCSLDVLAKGIQLGIEQYRLVTAERELLQKTLKGSIKVLTEVLSLINPEAFGRSSRIKRHVKELASHLGLPEVWQFELAAMLSQVGCVILPEKALMKIYHGQDLTEEENQLFDQHPMIASSLLFNIPRMEKVAEIIRYQEKHFDGSGNPKDNRQGKDIPLGARILKVALDFDMLEQNGITRYQALEQLKARTGWYDPDILAAVDTIPGDEVKYFAKEINVRELRPDMILDEDVYTTKGRLLILRGQEISPLLINRLKNFASTTGIQEPIRALIPVEFSTKTFPGNDKENGAKHAE
ncbi:MAG: hypothetical protein JRJ85_11055, partial [Deltaproteobacteria bacterium]|nr:hypothetical protein [Deltaproteobacteria bacterium]